MRASRLIAAGALLPLLGAAAPERAARNADIVAAAADARAVRLEARAAEAADDAGRTRLREAAIRARIRAAGLAVAAAEARIGMTERRHAAERARLAEQRAPATRLIAAVQSLARRPVAIAIVQPGSTRDIVHARALLGTMLPVVRARSEQVRRDLARLRALGEATQEMAAAVREGRARLQAGQIALVRFESDRRLNAGGRRPALYESERAIALGEQARSLAGLMASTTAAGEVRSALAQLPGPLPRPERADARPDRFAVPPYRLPVGGRIVEGLGELSDTGVRARGLTLAVAPGARIVAPAAGTMVFARGFRGYGTVVIIDHGAGWSSALTGLDGVDAAVGERVAQGQAIGRAPMADAPRIGVELRRRGTAMDIAQLLG